MSKKKKKVSGGSKPAQQQPEIDDQASGIKEEKAGNATVKAKEKKAETPSQFAEIEKKWLDMDDQTWIRAAWVITGLAAFLRFVALTLRPFHHDEGVNGWMLTNLIRDNNYHYDPANYHGPTIYYFVFPMLKLIGLDTVSLATRTLEVRGLTSFVGLLIVILVLLLRRYLGNIGSLLAALFIAISPGMVFTSRYFIHEMYFIFFCLALIVSMVYFIEKKPAGTYATVWMALILLVCFLPGGLMLGKYLGGENESTVTGLRIVFFAVDAAITYYLIKRLLAWDEGRPIYFLLAASSLSMIFATKETGFITLGTNLIACACVSIWDKIGPGGEKLGKSAYNFLLFCVGMVAATGVYYYSSLNDAWKYINREWLTNSWRPPETALFYTVVTLFAISIILLAIYLMDLKKSNEVSFVEPVRLEWKNFWMSIAAGVLAGAFAGGTVWIFFGYLYGLIAGLGIAVFVGMFAGDPKNKLLLTIVATVLFCWLFVVFFTSFFSYKEGVGKAFEAYDIWTKTGTKEHSQNGFFAYFKWGVKGEAPIILGSIIATLAAMMKGKQRFAMFMGLSAAGIFAAYIIIPYKTPWLALSYVMPMCIITGYGLGEFIKSSNRRLVLAAYAFLVVGVGILGYQTYQHNFVRHDDDQMPYVYAHTRRGFEDMIKKIEHYAEKSGEGKEFGISVTSPDYWPMTWYVLDYKHVGYHGRVIDNPVDDVIVTKKKDQDTEAIAKYSETYRYAGMYPLRPGVDLNLLVKKEYADPPCTSNEPKAANGECTQELSVIPTVPMTP